MRHPDRSQETPREHDARHLDRDRERVDADLRAMKLIGTFRAADSRDLPPGADLSRLEDAGLVRRYTAELRRGRDHAEVCVLTPEGLDMLEAQQHPGDPQRYWSGLVKPAELEHDLEQCRVFMDAAKEIEENGGQLIRVVLDHEMKGLINSQMNRPGPESQDDRRHRLAEEHDLHVVDGRVALPDFRIEYQDADGREQHIDMEVTTRHYTAREMAAKRASGFKMVRSSSSPRAAVRDDHRLGWLG